MRRAALVLLLVLAGCGHRQASPSPSAPKTTRPPAARPHARLLAELIRLGRNEATRDRIRVYADGTADVILGHGGGGQTTTELVYTRRGFAALRAILARTSTRHPGPAGHDPGLHGGSVYFFILSFHGRRVRAAQGAEPPRVRSLMRALSALADGGGPVHKRREGRTGPAPNAS